MRSRKRWSLHNDLSGKEFYPDVGENGTWMDVPQRFYIHTPWGVLIVASNLENGCQMWFPWKVKNKWSPGGKSHYSDHIWSPITWHPKSKPPVLHRGNIGLIIKEITTQPSELVQHYLDEGEWGVALVETLADVAHRPEADRWIEADIHTEINDLIHRKGINPNTRRAVEHYLGQISSVYHLRRGGLSRKNVERAVNMSGDESETTAAEFDTMWTAAQPSDTTAHDPVNHPRHYRDPSGIEAIQITRLCGFSLGNAVKYCYRYNQKNGHEDLKKARWYLNDVLTTGAAHHPPHKAKTLLQQVIDAQPASDRRQLLTHLRNGNLTAAINLITTLVGDDT